MRDSLICISVFALGGCLENGGSCTLNVEPAIEVEVRDAGTEDYLAVTPAGVAREGTYQDSLLVWGLTVDVPPRVTSLAGASERAGTYSLHVEAVGYEPWDTAGIRVSEGECHVRTVRLTAGLRSLP